MKGFKKAISEEESAITKNDQDTDFRDNGLEQQKKEATSEPEHQKDKEQV